MQADSYEPMQADAAAEGTAMNAILSAVQGTKSDVNGI
jgi:hypothetical protein